MSIADRFMQKKAQPDDDDRVIDPLAERDSFPPEPKKDLTDVLAGDDDKAINEAVAGADEAKKAKNKAAIAKNDELISKVFQKLALHLELGASLANENGDPDQAQFYNHFIGIINSEQENFERWLNPKQGYGLDPKFVEKLEKNPHMHRHRGHGLMPYHRQWRG